ncbi:hypothetical protein [Geoalkalibacter subterraneus]|uniref:Holin n=1 Tax=Geoalkalibacter subterraneus TaxID=483547 RepID=A0A0B5FK45_9BACT|nr:hypothetical protein [Geoalkalibacter subterraneus]AJF07778.1 hypothetical protein GSUB_16135 [Geoalkalibacter subterraneus]
MATGKKIYLSKTFWTNVVALLAMVLQSFTGFVIDPETQVSLLAAINVALRLMTKEPVTWGDKTDPHVGAQGTD